MRNLTVHHFETPLADEWRVTEEDEDATEMIVGVFLLEADARQFAKSPDMEAACLTVADELEALYNAPCFASFTQMQAWIDRLRAALPKESEEPKP